MHDIGSQTLQARYGVELAHLVRSCIANLDDPKKCEEAEQNRVYAPAMCNALSTAGIESTCELSLQVLRLSDIMYAKDAERAGNIKSDAHTILVELCSRLETQRKVNLVQVCWHECGHVMMAHKNKVPSEAVIVDWHDIPFSWAGRRFGADASGRAGQEIYAGGVAAELYLARAAGHGLSSLQLDNVTKRAGTDIKKYEASTAHTSDCLSFLDCATEISHLFNAAEGAIMRRMVTLLIERKRLGAPVLRALLNEIEPTVENFKDDEFLLNLEAQVFQGYPQSHVMP
ncbi:hypothetical protein GOB86_12650 [Acetobacter lambici]|uniref:Peptidase M41 domain-containing protein n=1 Tax=Acetobacter lambici TaxID=1332824 RepID=A0ABT1F464_9PROT|nr:hypothetical protein [Acetobacter lambici]MCP1242758.1 hypothetical protein [Acetobacter lambici]MCP1258928.1 hypothetical protein [Acetobacter lambici]NHO57894.1 hypothetical protein [Acetobacter lambici]